MLNGFDFGFLCHDEIVIPIGSVVVFWILLPHSLAEFQSIFVVHENLSSWAWIHNWWLLSLQLCKSFHQHCVFAQQLVDDLLIFLTLLAFVLFFCSLGVAELLFKHFHITLLLFDLPFVFLFLFFDRFFIHCLELVYLFFMTFFELLNFMLMIFSKGGDFLSHGSINRGVAFIFVEGRPFGNLRECFGWEVLFEIVQSLPVSLEFGLEGLDGGDDVGSGRIHDESR